MRKLKKRLTALFAAALVFILSSSQAFADSQVIEDISIQINEPTVGEAPSDEVTLPEDAGYECADVEWIRNYSFLLPSPKVFAEGESYSVYFFLTEKDGNQFAETSKLNITVNGDKPKTVLNISDVGSLIKQDWKSALLIYFDFGKLGPKESEDPGIPAAEEEIPEEEIPEEEKTEEEVPKEEKPEEEVSEEIPPEEEKHEEVLPEENLPIEDVSDNDDGENTQENQTPGDADPIVVPVGIPVSEQEVQPVLEPEPESGHSSFETPNEQPSFVEAPSLESTLAPLPETLPLENVQKEVLESVETLPEEPSFDIAPFEGSEEVVSSLAASVEASFLDKFGEDASYEDLEYEIFEVTLMVQDASGNLVPASPENFPENGKLTVVLPYPEGTNAKDYSFVVSHMFTTDYFGKVPGDIECPDVRLTGNGIEFDVTGLSPIALGWLRIFDGSPKPKVVVTTIEPENEALEIDDEELPLAPGTSSKTFWAIVATVGVLAFAAVVYIIIDKQRENRPQN